MQKKFIILSYILVFIVVVAIFAYLITGTERIKRAKEAFAGERIEQYTNQYFRFADAVQINTRDDMTSVSVSFVPEVGSFPIKEDIYESIASHALRITEFFPEVTHFKYTVLWDDYTKNEVMYLEIDKEAVEQLGANYYGQLNNRDGGLETSFHRVFSSIAETEESKTWRGRVDPNAPLP